MYGTHRLSQSPQYKSKYNLQESELRSNSPQPEIATINFENVL